MRNARITATKFNAEIKRAGMKIMPAGIIDLGIPTMWAQREIFAGGLEFHTALAYLVSEKARLQGQLLPGDRGVPDLSVDQREGVRGK